MTPDPHAGLSAREREIMDIIHRLGSANAIDVESQMESPPTNATVRSALRVLEEKGWLTHRRDGAKYVYAPVLSTEQTRRKAVGHLVKTFFHGSPTDAVAALVGDGERLSPEERRRIAEMLKKLEEQET